MSHSHKLDTTKGVGTALSFLQCCLPAVYQHLNYLYYKNWLDLNKTRESEPGRVSMTRTMLKRDLVCFKYAELAIIFYG